MRPGASRLIDRQWTLGALAALALHGGVFGALFIRIGSRATPIESQAIAIDMAPVAVAPPAPTHDVPTPDQIEAPQPKPDPQPVVKKLPFDPPPDIATETPADALVPKQPHDDPSPPAKQAPPAPQTTRLASLDAAPDKRTAAPVDGGLTSGATKPEDIWYSRVIGQIQRAKRYPTAARILHQEDNIAVKIEIDRMGKLVLTQLLASHGIEQLDREALDAVHRAAPFPKPPPEVAGDPVTAKLLVQFAITR